jgi:hypothetical protein
VPYDLNVPFWSDGAVKRRWFSIPDVTRKIKTRGAQPWEFPEGTVWIKHFELELVKGEPSSSRRVETRFLVRNGEGVYGATYRWNDSQDNATLVPEEGADQSFTIDDHGTVRQQTWHFPSRNECLTCHTPVAGFALGFTGPATQPPRDLRERHGLATSRARSRRLFLRRTIGEERSSIRPTRTQVFSLACARISR